MSVNLTNGSSPPSNSSLSPPEEQCVDTVVGRNVLIAFSCTYTLLILPLCLLVLHLGFQRWRRRRPVSSDVFTYNTSVMELVGIVGYLLYHCSSYAELPHVSLCGLLLGLFSWFGQTLFPMLTCAESYLAVVHPITYRRVGRAGGVRVRNACAGCVWLMCGVWVCVRLLLTHSRYSRRAASAFTLTVSLLTMVFCSLSVLRVLIRPRPGRAGGAGARPDRSKRRAVRTVLVLMAVLWLKIGGNVVLTLVKFSPLVSVKCAGEALTFVVFLPCGFALPLLFLHRAGKVPSCRRSAGRDQVDSFESRKGKRAR